jgi:hypothetical protein
LRHRCNVVSTLEPAHRVRLHEPEIDGHDACFRWEVAPASELYQRSDFRLSFPPQLDLHAVPRALWWRIALICLYPHWALLRPCRVELPVALGAAEREFWMRLIDNAAVQLEAYGGTPRPGRAAELVDAGPTLAPAALAGTGDRAAVAFSGGKDSLALSALLAELTERPLLVSTTSPVPWARDYTGVGRDRALAEIVKRLPVDVIEVRSDFRSCYRMNFAARDGCTLGTHLLSDVPLFQAATIAVAAAAGARRTFMASEADCQYNTARDGHVIQHVEFVSSAATQAALDALLSGFGLRQGSLTYPLHMPLVQGLLLRRYRALADLQFSCWQAPDGAQACSACAKCFQIALVTLAEGVSPRELGIDPVRVLCAFGDWRLNTPATHAGPRLHETRSSRDHLVRCLQELPTSRVESILTSDALARQDARLGEAFAVYARLRADALSLSTPPALGYVAGFLEMIDADLRGPLRAIFDEHFSPAPAREFAGMLERSQALAGWIAEPLQGRGRSRSTQL